MTNRIVSHVALAVLSLVVLGLGCAPQQVQPPPQAPKVIPLGQMTDEQLSERRVQVLDWIDRDKEATRQDVGRKLPRSSSTAVRQIEIDEQRTDADWNRKVLATHRKMLKDIDEEFARRGIEPARRPEDR